jgi:hypothetical protein
LLSLIYQPGTNHTTKNKKKNKNTHTGIAKPNGVSQAKRSEKQPEA